jgi:hypothetical protein
MNKEKQALLLKLSEPHEGFKMEFQRRYDEEGRVAVLISPGFGAGWSSWSSSEQTEGLLFDSRLVDFVLTQGSEGLGDYAESLGYTGYMGGASDVQVEWLEPGTRFMIDEYDGSESIRTFDDLCYVA